MRIFVTLLAVCIVSASTFAAPTTFENKGLKWVIVVALDVNGKTATGN